jgi:hypothetical protein
VRAIVLALVLSIGFLVLTLNAIRRQQLREQQAVLWLTVSLVMVFLSATLPLHILDDVAHLVGIAYPPDLILLLGVLFLFLLVFHLSTSLTKLAERNTTLVQEIGLLKTQQPSPPPAPSVPSTRSGRVEGALTHAPLESD